MECVDPNQNLYYQGDFDSPYGSSIMISIDYCIGQSHCKEKDEIDEFIKAKRPTLISVNPQ